MSEIDSYIRTHSAELSRLCFSLCKNTADAEDLFQETWIRVLRGIDSFDRSRDFRKWLFSVCCNAYKDGLRRAKNRETLFDTREHMERFLSSLPDRAESRDDYTLLYRAIEDLSPKLRTALSLRYFSSLSEEEVAQVLGISCAAARKRISRGIAALKVSMNGGKT